MEFVDEFAQFVNEFAMNLSMHAIWFLPSLNFHIPCGVLSGQVSLVLSCRGTSCQFVGPE